MIVKSTIYNGVHNPISCWSIFVAQNYRTLVSERRFRKKKVRPSIFSVWLHGVEKNEWFFFSENGPDDGQAPLGYPQKQYEDGGPPLFLSRSEDIRAGTKPPAFTVAKSAVWASPLRKTKALYILFKKSVSTV